MGPEQEYRNRIINYASKMDAYKAKRKWLPVGRGILFIMIVLIIYFYVSEPEVWKALAACLTFIILILLSWLDSALNRKILQCSYMIDINNREINSLNNEFHSFDPGTEFIEHDHPYTHDLDIFGNNSLFQSINRTATIFGKNRLADYFRNAYRYRDEIKVRQEAILELSGNHDFRQGIRLIFHGQHISEDDRKAWNDWLQSGPLLKHPFTLKMLVTIMPVFTVSAIVLSSLDIIIYQIPVILVLLQFFFVTIYGRLTLKTHNAVTSNFGILGKYAQCLELIENIEFKSLHLQSLTTHLSNSGEKPPSKVIKSLSQLMNMLDTNLNLFAASLLNGLFMFNLHMIIAVDNWKSRHRDLIPKWFEVIAEIDALASLGNFAYNNPHYKFPVPVYDEFVFEARDMGHPLIPKEDCVTNSIEINGWNRFCIITGANMSGKSTFLRTVGSNYILGMMGAPVYAAHFTFYPIELHSSIRTNDSLAKNESYFYAELKRLKEIIVELEKGKQKLILLDEILKGTNSSDKQSGSIALIRQLLKYKLAGMFATHDLKLGELINQYPEHIKNLCFEIEIADDHMQIDYILHEGICKNLNATFLMKNMGILLD
jgi:DNA mismatch repair ATPase MutS